MQYKKPIKSLSPSLKENKRYLLLKGKDLRVEVEKSIFDFIGVLGMSKTGLNWVKANKEQAVIAVNREMLNDVKACFSVWPSKIQVVKVSGTLKGLGAKIE